MKETQKEPSCNNPERDICENHKETLEGIPEEISGEVLEEISKGILGKISEVNPRGILQ